MAEERRNRRKGNVTSRWMAAIHIAFILLAICVAARIVYLQIFWQPSKLQKEFYQARQHVDSIRPVRGAIYDTRGKLLASSSKLYQVSMDCVVRKEEFKNDPAKELEWRNKAAQLSEGLARIYGGSAADWERSIIHNRDNNHHYLKIGRQIDFETLSKVKELPLFNEGSNKGGIQVTVEEIRSYPYGSLGRRAIGVVKNNQDRQQLTGIEEKCNSILHGKEGWTMLKDSDIRGVYVPGNNWKSKKAVDGMDVKTTLDITMQEIADNALREMLSENDAMTGGCCMVMETATGAIRAMVNLTRDKDGNLGETYNYAVTTAQNPGSVFKTATLMAAIEKAGVDIHDTIPTKDGKVYYRGASTPVDAHVGKAHYPDGKITVDEGLKISSNYVFRYLAVEKFGKESKDVDKYMESLEEYHLFDDFDFDINGLAKCYIKDPRTSGEALTLPSIAMGYDMRTTPLHILTFYNAIANGGKEMKPYMIEEYLRDGKVEKKFGPEVLERSICSKRTADSLTIALLKITQEEHGTAYWRMLRSKCKIAGKTGTAYQTYTDPNTGKATFGAGGFRKIQGSFAGFFPAEDPKYTAICVFYTRVTGDNLEGSRCATPVRKIADELFCLHPEWAVSLEKNGKMDKVSKVEVVTGKNNDGKVPDLSGLGLSDAIYSLESCGYKCVYEGAGQVASQSPAAWSKLAKGGTVMIRLK
ncbi:MAG: PASTA domain-containing protein [Bacteroidales bacterium]|nr:PASTA domain-containing protein [Bacteroidales bacterium]